MSVEATVGKKISWDPWSPDGERAGESSIAQFVVPDAFPQGSELRLPDAQNESDLRDIASALYVRLAAHGFHYRAESALPQPRGFQQIHHLAWMEADGGNCLDLSLIYAAQCLDADISPLIALIEGHAFVLVAGARGVNNRRDPLALLGCEPNPGERELRGALLAAPGALSHAISNGELISVDCEQAVRDGSFEYAESVAASFVERRSLRLFDVACLQSQGLLPLDAPVGRPAQRRYPPAVWDLPELEQAQNVVADTVRRMSLRPAGIVVHAQSGQGKSTVARGVMGSRAADRGWFLDATDVNSLRSDLARAELLERGEMIESLAGDELDGLAKSALLRLSRTTEPWKVLLDNAGPQASDLLKHVPTPRHAGQLMLVTTTFATEWESLGLTALELSSVDASSQIWGDSEREVKRLVDGRALVFSAFENAFVALGIPPQELLAAAESSRVSGLPAELRAPAALWHLVRGDDEKMATAGIAATLLPPEHIPLGLIEQIGGVASQKKLEEARIMQKIGDEYSLHRLFAAAISAYEQAAAGDFLIRSTCVTLLDSDLATEALDRYASRELVGELATILLGVWEAAGSVERRTLVGTMGRMAAACEFRGEAQPSYELQSLVLAELDAADSLTADERMARAEALFALGRRANRVGEPTVEILEEGLNFANRARVLAVELRGAAKTGRFFAMEGLLVKKLAEKRKDANADAELRDAEQLLIKADDLRRADSDASTRERLLSRFNLAGLGVSWASLTPDNAEAHLDSADAIYDEVAAARKIEYRTQIHPHIATCYQGRAYVGYFRALRVSRGTESRIEALEAAHLHLSEALAQWREIGNEVEIAKANDFLVKLAAARSKVSLMDGSRQAQLSDKLEKLFEKISEELAWAGDE